MNPSISLGLSPTAIMVRIFFIITAGSYFSACATLSGDNTEAISSTMSVSCKQVDDMSTGQIRSFDLLVENKSEEWLPLEIMSLNLSDTTESQKDTKVLTAKEAKTASLAIAQKNQVEAHNQSLLLDSLFIGSLAAVALGNDNVRTAGAVTAGTVAAVEIGRNISKSKRDAETSKTGLFRQDEANESVPPGLHISTRFMVDSKSWDKDHALVSRWREILFRASDVSRAQRGIS